MENSKELAEIKERYNGVIPLVYTVMAEKQVLSEYWPIIQDAMIVDAGIQNPFVKQGIMVALSSACGNNYCFIAHAYQLYNLGLSVETIKELVNQLRFPLQVDECEKWSLVLKWAFLFGRTPGGTVDATDDSHQVICDLLDNNEYRALYKICVVNDMLNRFTEFYHQQIQVENDERFIDASAKLKLPIPELTKYYETISQSDGETEKPVVAICSSCKNIRDVEGKWHALETVLASLDRNSTFSHGVCPRCYKKVVELIDAV